MMIKKNIDRKVFSENGIIFSFYKKMPLNNGLTVWICELRFFFTLKLIIILPAPTRRVTQSLYLSSARLQLSLDSFNSIKIAVTILLATLTIIRVSEHYGHQPEVGGSPCEVMDSAQKIAAARCCGTRDTL